MKSITILNGQIADSQRGRQVREISQRVGASLRVTEQPGDASKWARSAAEDGVERLVIAGGDGTVHEVVQGLAPDFPDVELAIIPLGTGNDLARSLDLPLHNIPAAAEIAFHGPTALIDVVQIVNGQQRYFVNAASGGFGGAVTFQVSSDSKKTWGAFAYWFAALSKLSQLPEYEVELHSDHDIHHRRVVGIGISNGGFVGGGFPLAPNAKLDDGQLAITVVPATNPLELMGMAVDLSLGRRQQSEKLLSFRTKCLRLTCKPAMPFSLDGEIETTTAHRFDVLPAKLRIGIGARPALKKSPP